MSLYSETFGSGRDLVLVHGWGLHGGIFEPLTEHLAQKYRVTVIDMPGHGNSTTLPAGGFDLTRLAQLLLDNAPEKATWIGWSLGGMAALDIALTYTDRVEQLIMIGAQPQFVQTGDWPHAMNKDSVAGFAAALQEDYQNTLKRFLGLQVRGTETEKTLLRTIRRQVASRPIANKEALRLGLDILINANLRSRLNHLHCPTQFIFGELDMLVPIAAKQQLQMLLPQANFAVIEKTGHAPFLSHPEAFNKILDSFLESR